MGEDEGKSKKEEGRSAVAAAVCCEGRGKKEEGRSAVAEATCLCCAAEQEVEHSSLLPSSFLLLTSLPTLLPSSFFLLPSPIVVAAAFLSLVMPDGATNSTFRIPLPVFRASSTESVRRVLRSESAAAETAPVAEAGPAASAEPAAKAE